MGVSVISIFVDESMSPDLRASYDGSAAFHVDANRCQPYLEGIEINFTSELQNKLGRLAAEQGRDTKALAQEAVERVVTDDKWFIR